MFSKRTASSIHWLRGCILTVLFSLWMDLTSGIDVQLIPQDPEVGQSVILSVGGINERINSINWYKGLNPSPENQIINYIPSANPPEVQGKLYFSDAQGFPNGSLLIRNLVKEREGNYTVRIQLSSPQQASVYLPVRDPDVGVTFPDDRTGLTGGQIAGIVLGTTGGVLLIIGASFLIYKNFFQKS